MKRPYVFINSAMSADGKISTVARVQVAISGKADKARVDALRAGCDAIMVGVGTVLSDDPKLLVKSMEFRRGRVKKGLTENPLRVIADSCARTPQDAKVLGDGCLIAVSRSAPSERVEALRMRSRVIVCGNDRVDLKELLETLYGFGVRRLMVEGGATLNWSLIECGLVDEITAFVGPMIIGGSRAPTLVDGNGFLNNYPGLKLGSVMKVDGGVLIQWFIGGDGKTPV